MTRKEVEDMENFQYYTPTKVVFGKGTVVVSGEKDGSYIIQFDKFKTTRRISKEITLYPS